MLVHDKTTLALDQSRGWKCADFEFSTSKTDPIVVMGIINVTPDSFSDGGQFSETSRALKHAEQLVYDGAHILDVGGESTRPGAAPVSVEQELSRVIPLIEQLAKAGHCVSVDTRKPEVMRAAIASGAAIVNDVYALRAPGAVEVCAASDVGVVLMHMQGEPSTMQAEPIYENVAREVSEFLHKRATACEASGIARARIALDPGFGFGKTTAHNLELTQKLDQLVQLGFPIVAGWSRKRTIGELTGRSVAAERVSGSVAAALACVARGARIVRVHDVKETVEALRVWRALGPSLQ